VNANPLREPRRGILLHYSDGDFASTAAWCRDPASQVSYNLLIGPAGETDLIVPFTLRAWHAGVCRPSRDLAYTDANSALEGIALAGGPAYGPVTDPQFQQLIATLYDRFVAHDWPRDDTWRITGHDREAWPRGRKPDPTGPNAAAPWLDLDTVRAALLAL
jgi:Negative regulator of beta-lactamase expression